MIPFNRKRFLFSSIAILFTIIFFACTDQLDPQPDHTGHASDSGSRDSVGADRKERFPRIHRVVCVNRAQGCPCRKEPRRGSGIVLHLNHFEPVYNATQVESPVSNPSSQTNGANGPSNKKNNHGWFLIQRDGGSCYVPDYRLQKMTYHPVDSSPLQKKDHEPVALNRFVENLPEKEKDAKDFLTDSSRVKKVSLGKFWPTFYHLALEDFHPGKKIPIRNPKGKVIGKTSEEFLRQVRWEGSGLLSNGKKIRWAGTKDRFDSYTKARWGYGAGYGYQVYPYRTLAVNFPGICKKLGKRMPKNCRKKDVIGLMVYIPEIARKKIPMQGGNPHDGFFCLTDTGSPHYIKYDRIDMFVGVHGGGNPYLPPGRRSNLFIKGGIDSVKPYHWKLWKTEKKRVWCDQGKLPRNPQNPEPGSCLLDYHATAPELALEMEALFSEDGKPIRCVKKPQEK